MIVWGGHNNNIGEFNTGGRYNPGTDTWIATTIVNAPSARNSHGNLDRQRNDYLGRWLRYRRQIQSRHEQLDGYQHH